MSKLLALLALFRAGNVVLDPVKWKKRQISATMLIPAIAASVYLAKIYGYDIPLTDEDLSAIATVLLILVNVVLTVTTSAGMGVSSRTPNDDRVAESPTAAPPARVQVDSGADREGGDPQVQSVTGRDAARRTNPFRDDTA